MQILYIMVMPRSKYSSVTGTQSSYGNNIQTMNQLLQLVGPKGYKRSLLIALSLDTGTEPLKEVLLFISVANLVLHEDKFQFLCRIFDAPNSVSFSFLLREFVHLPVPHEIPYRTPMFASRH